MSTPEWETSKENIAPVARGRNVETLTKALAKTPAELEDERVHHQAAIRDASKGVGPYGSDPLAPWVTYVKWAVDNFPVGSDLLVAAIEGACRKFAKEPRYLNDRRFVRLWIRYADMRKDKLDVFEYMQRRRIGEHAALFYEAWATTFELERNYDKAEDTYALGKSIGAEPADRLAQRQREFFARMAARRKRSEKKAKEAAEKKAAAEKAKEASKSGRGRSGLADSILSRSDVEGAADTETAPGDENAAPGPSRQGTRTVRPALGKISEEQAQTGRRPFAPAERKPSGGPHERSKPRAASQGNGKQNAAKIEVYADPTPPPASPRTAHRGAVEREEKFPLPLLAKQDEVHKENDGRMPSKWAGETLPQNDSMRSKVRGGGPAPRETFQIYQDTDKGEKRRPEKSSAVEESTKKPPTRNRGQSPAPARKPSGRLSRPISPTINTKIAMREIEDMFNSSLPVEMDDGENTAETPLEIPKEKKENPSTTFEIYRDVDDKDKENALGVRKESREGGSGPSGNPDLERRVFRPIPELEGPHIVRPREKSDDENMPPPPETSGGGEQREERADVAHEKPSEEFLDFLAEWCSQDPTYFLLDGADPDVEEGGMFDLQPKQNPSAGSQVGFSPLKPHSEVSFDVDDVVWKGHDGHSTVFSVEDMNDIFGLKDVMADDENAPDSVIALKVSETSNAWEYYIYKTVHDRYGAPLKNVANAVAFYEGSPRTYLLLDSMYCCSLADCVNLTKDKYLSECLAMFFTSDLLRTLEALHAVGIIHSDVTLENVLFRNNHHEDLIEDRYVASGAGSWGKKGVMLVDYNHAIDSKQTAQFGTGMDALASHAVQLGNKFLDKDYRIPGANRWSFNADCYAAAVCSAKMLGLPEPKTKDCQQKLKHVRIWDVYFAAMKNLSATAKPSETVDTMRRCREEMEGALVGEKWLKVSITRLSTMAETKDAHDDTVGAN